MSTGATCETAATLSVAIPSAAISEMKPLLVLAKVLVATNCRVNVPAGSPGIVYSRDCTQEAESACVVTSLSVCPVSYASLNSAAFALKQIGALGKTLATNGQYSSAWADLIVPVTG